MFSNYPGARRLQGLPRKNLKTVDGVPLVARAVRSALAAGRITRMVVSTDDEEIANVAREAGAEVVMRPEVIAALRETDLFIEEDET